MNSSNLENKCTEETKAGSTKTNDVIGDAIDGVIEAPQLSRIDEHALEVRDDTADEIANNVTDENNVENLRFQLQMKDVKLASLHDKVNKLTKVVNQEDIESDRIAREMDCLRLAPQAALLTTVDRV